MRTLIPTQTIGTTTIYQVDGKGRLIDIHRKDERHVIFYKIKFGLATTNYRLYYGRIISDDENGITYEPCKKADI